EEHERSSAEEGIAHRQVPLLSGETATPWRYAHGTSSLRMQATAINCPGESTASFWSMKSRVVRSKSGLAGGAWPGSARAGKTAAGRALPPVSRWREGGSPGPP